MNKGKQTSNYPSNLLCDLRINAGLSQKALGQIAGVSPTMINFLESGSRKFSDEVAGRLANALLVEKALLLGLSNYGVIVLDRKGKDYGKTHSLSFSEYLRQKRLGNIVDDVTTSLDVRLDEADIENYEASDEEINSRLVSKGTMYFFERYFDYPENERALLDTDKEEIFKAVSGMDGDQLRKTLLMIKEVILK